MAATRDSSFNSAYKVCSELSSCVEDLGEAKRVLEDRQMYISFYWEGKAGEAMATAISTLAQDISTLSQRIDSLYESMINSAHYDYNLWMEATEEV